MYCTSIRENKYFSMKLKILQKIVDVNLEKLYIKIKQHELQNLKNTLMTYKTRNNKLNQTKYKLNIIN